MRAKVRQALLIACMLWLSWLIMMLVHEGGHVTGAVCSGGTVREVVWHPSVISRTDVSPNPHPLIEVWAGPLVGSVMPLAAAYIASCLRLRAAYLVWFVAGFCLIANGAYLGSGAIDPVGDAKQLIAHATPRWILAAFGCVTVIPGFWIWHRISARLGLDHKPVEPDRRHLHIVLAVAAAISVGGFIFGNAGR